VSILARAQRRASAFHHVPRSDAESLIRQAEASKELR
jgi:hypothetical protein